MGRAVDFDGAPLAVLVELMGSDTPGERADAACALGDRLRSRELDGLEPSQREALATLLDDATPGVRFEAAMALAEAHDERATTLLLASIRVRSVRLDAIRALGTLGDQRAVEPLRRVMHRWLMPWADKLQAAAALCALADRDGANYLENRLASRRKAERAAAIHFIGESRHPRARALLEPLLRTTTESMRDVAARALGLLGDPQVRKVLEEVLDAIPAGGDRELAEDIEQALRRLTAAT